MKKALTVVLAVVFLLLTSAAGTGGDAKISGEEEFLRVLGEYRERGVTEFQVSLTEEYFESVRADSFAQWSILELRAGIISETLKYSFQGDLLLEDVVWGDRDWAECADREEVFAAVAEFTARECREFILLCPDELKENLREENLICNFAARCGAADLSVLYSRSGGLIFVEDIRYMEVPHAVAGSQKDFLAAVSAFAQENVPAFNIVFEPDFYDQVNSDKELMRLMLYTSPLDDYRYTRSSYFRTWYYTDATYSLVPRVICQSEEDIVNAIRQMGGIQADAFNLILNEELYETVRADGFQRLHQLEGDAGMTDAAMSYDYINYIFYYTDAVITANSQRLTTMEEVMAFMAEKAAGDEKEFTLFLTDELFAQLMEGVSQFSLVNDGMARIYDVIANNGLFDYSLGYSSDGHYIQFHVTSWYPGTQIIAALARGEEDGLSGRVLETYQAAKRIAAECVADTPLQTAKNLHDRLCDMVVYTDDDTTDEDDNAIGAILNGKANCDGYTDAFYLLGTLSGLEVRYQHGDSYQLGIQAISLESVTHMWNLLRLDGTWRLVDVTWDDAEERGTVYTWFNLGQDRAARMHIWNKETTVKLDPETDRGAFRPANEYEIWSLEDARTAVRAALEARQPNFELIWHDENEEIDRWEILRFLDENGPSGYRYIWNERMLTLSVIGLEY